MATHPSTAHPDLIVGFGTSDDAGVFRLPGGGALVQTVDFFTPVVDDPYDWGRIAAANALSDVYAMGGTPLTALQLVAWPRDVIPFEVLGRVIEGGADVMAAAGCTVVGGHSIDDSEPKYGFAVTGLAEPGQVITNAGAVAGDVLVLTKPLGSGIITTAIKAGSATEESARAVVETMAALNDQAAAAACEVGVHAATDVTGYGLLGHLREVLEASGVGARVSAGEVPLLPGVRDLADAGVYPSGSGRNLEAILPHLSAVGVDDVTVQILADAQTSGGLLISIGADRLETLRTELKARRVLAAVVGEITAGPVGEIEVTP